MSSLQPKTALPSSNVESGHFTMATSKFETDAEQKSSLQGDLLTQQTAPMLLHGKFPDQ